MWDRTEGVWLMSLDNQKNDIVRSQGSEEVGWQKDSKKRIGSARTEGRLVSLLLCRMQQVCQRLVPSGSPVALCWLEIRVVMEGDYAACGYGADLKRNGNSSTTRDGVRKVTWS